MKCIHCGLTLINNDQAMSHASECSVMNCDQDCESSNCGGFKGCVCKSFDENNSDCMECLNDASAAIEWADKERIKI